MNRLQINLTASMILHSEHCAKEITRQCHLQGFDAKGSTVKDIALEIRDDLGFKRCIRMLDSLIFTKD